MSNYRQRLASEHRARRQAKKLEALQPTMQQPSENQSTSTTSMLGRLANAVSNVVSGTPAALVSATVIASQTVTAAAQNAQAVATGRAGAATLASTSGTTGSSNSGDITATDIAVGCAIGVASLIFVGGIAAFWCCKNRGSAEENQSLTSTGQKVQTPTLTAAP